MTDNIKIFGPFKDLGRKKKFVKRMFDDISDRYDLMNRVISMGMDGPWRRRTIRPHKNDKLVLDICSGTGDMSREILKLEGFDGFIVLGDFAAEMNKLAKAKLADINNVCYVNCDAENLPFKPGVFDGVVNGYSMRNLGDLQRFGSEIERTLKPGGKASIIDMAHPPNKLVGWLFRIYFYRIAPWISRFFTSKEYAYKYLPLSLHTFLKQPEVLTDLKGEKLEGYYENVFGGMVAIYRLTKKS